MSRRGSLDYPLLLADAGGTNLRLAVQREWSGPIEPLARFKAAGFATFEDALRQGLGAAGVHPRAAAICGAGPETGGVIRITNGTWRLDRRRIATEFGFSQCLLLNDLEALAYGLPALGSGDLAPIGPSREASQGTRLAIGVGTGFGTAALVEGPGRSIAIATEAGHMGLGPTTPEEAAFWPFIAAEHGRVFVETLLSGSGLSRLEAAIRRSCGERAEDRSPEAIIEAARSGQDASAAQAIGHFNRMLGRVTGDLALAFKATGGVFLAGGLMQALGGGLDARTFRTAFEAKAPLGDLVAPIATWLVTGDSVALAGLAAAACRDDARIS